MQDYKTLKKDAEKYIRYEKDRKNRIAYLTFDRVDALNAANIGMRQNYADLIHKANADDEVKVLVIRGGANTSAAAAIFRSRATCCPRKAASPYCRSSASTMKM